MPEQFPYLLVLGCEINAGTRVIKTSSLKIINEKPKTQSNICKQTAKKVSPFYGFSLSTFVGKGEYMQPSRLRL